METSQDLISGNQRLMMIGTFTLWDVATIGLSINTTGSSPTAWTFSVAFWITSNSNQGIIGGLINRVLDSLTSTVNRVAQQWESDVRAGSAAAVESSRRAFANAQTALNQAQINFDNDIASVRSTLTSISDSAATSLSNAQSHGANCKWWKPWWCVR